METPPDALVVLCTCPDEASAAGIATALLAAGLAACVNLIPGLRSMYIWEGQVRDDAEVLLVIKTRTARYAALEASILARHPYENPEIIGVPVIVGAAPYLDWVRQATGP
jgi:periplasmic divalent cation tolerance protein